MLSVIAWEEGSPGVLGPLHSHYSDMWNQPDLEPDFLVGLLELVLTC